jgi:hypothetical protein
MPTETEAKRGRPKKKKKLSEMMMEELQNLATEKGIPYWGKTKGQLILDLVEEGDDPEVVVIDRAKDFTRDQLLDFERRLQLIPGKTIAYKKDMPIIDAYLSKNNMAFNNCDLTDETARTRHIFGTRDVICDCGDKFRMERKWEERAPGMVGPKGPNEVVQKFVSDADIRYCPTCNKKWIYHDLQTAKAADGKGDGGFIPTRQRKRIKV